MNTTVKRLIGALACVAISCPAIGWAAPPAGSVQAWLGMSALGDDGATPDQQADNFLRLARKAMAEGHLELAGSFISRAEQLNPHYSIFHTGDTPKKARMDLNHRLGLKADSGSYGAAPPTATLPTATLANSRDGQPKDPFLGHDMDQAGPAASGIGGNPGGTAVQMQIAQADGPGVGGIGAPSAYPSTGAPAAYPATGAPPAYPTTGAPPFQFAPQGNPATIPGGTSNLGAMSGNAVVAGQMPVATSNDATAARQQSETLLLAAQIVGRRRLPPSHGRRRASEKFRRSFR